jgi:hypothetical protein
MPPSVKERGEQLDSIVELRRQLEEEKSKSPPNLNKIEMLEGAIRIADSEEYHNIGGKSRRHRRRNKKSRNKKSRNNKTRNNKTRNNKKSNKRKSRRRRR